MKSIQTKSHSNVLQHRLHWLLFLWLLPGLLLFPQPGLAALGITSVSPNLAPNNVETVLSIAGTDFVDGAVASLEGYGALSTTFTSATALTARLPAGVPTGTYNVVVTNPDTTQVTLTNGLSVFTPSSTPTQTLFPTQTQTPPPTATPNPPPASFERPLVVIQSYRNSPDAASPGSNIDVYVMIYNAGQRTARNILVAFTPGNLLPLSTGGILAIGELTPGDKKELKQPFTATWDIWGLPVASLDMTASYVGPDGEPYTEKFSLNLPVVQPKIVARTATPTPTLTPTTTPAPIRRPQLVITRYLSSFAPLQPGLQFELELQVQNVGSDLAKNTTLIIGGGGGSAQPSTTDTPGGISGAGGEFTNFAPFGSSNIQALGDIPSGGMKIVHQPVIVNVNTNPGAYPMRISFTYLTERGVPITDEQVITLLVYSLPSVDISFYRDPGVLFAGQPNLLPLQIVNLGRKTTVLGNMRLSVADGELSNNVALIGTLETGGYFTLDATLIPLIPGPLELSISVDYTDDFNQSQQITRTLSLEVQEAMAPPPETIQGEGGEGLPVELAPETFLQKVWRFVRGFIGLDSARPSPTTNIEMPTDGKPVDGGSSEPVPVKPLKGP